MPQKVRGWAGRFFVNKCLLIEEIIAGQQILSSRFLGYHFKQKIGGAYPIWGAFQTWAKSY
jgi:hypothetical protein